MLVLERSFHFQFLLYTIVYYQYLLLYEYNATQPFGCNALLK